jgi:hypothetical protein
MDAQIYKCFISSPSDTQKERVACDEVFSTVNKSLGEKLHFRIESKKWERDVVPAFGEDAQTVITGQLLNNYQMFIGIMWNRFGTPTKRANSGTEEEFYHAYSKYLAQNNDIRLCFTLTKSPRQQLGWTWISS